MKLPFGLLVLLLASLLSAPAEPLPLPGAWGWQRENPAGWRVHDGVLELRAQKGRVWGGGGAENILIEEAAAGGRQITVDVSHGSPKNIYEQGGLLVHRDDEHFVKLILEFIEGEYYIVLAREITGKGRVFTKLEFADKSARLRLAVSGDTVSASFAARGSNQFEPAGDCELPGSADAHFALFTQDGSDDEVRWIRFEDVQVSAATGGAGGFDTRQLSDEFHAEGAAFGDINRDGINDIVYGPFWFEGPEFDKRHQIYKPNRFAIATYSNNFMPHIDDIDDDGWDDVLVLGFPGREKSTYWLENPGESGGAWHKHVVFGGPGNESPAWTDVDGDGSKEIVCSIKGQFVLISPNLSKPQAPWRMEAISPPGSTGGHFTHGLGLGDVDGDGLLDLLERTGWWRQTETGKLWEKHVYPFSGAGGAQMFAYDFDGDGDSDVVTSLAAHGFGLAWYEQVVGKEGGIDFVRHLIMGSRPGESDYALAFGGLHGLELADVDGDGVKDLITGTRYFAHNGNDPSDKLDPVIYWFQTRRGGGAGDVEFVPHLITPDTGIGTMVSSGDIDGDGKLDILIGNKKGCFVHLQNDSPAQALEEVGRETTDVLEGEALQILSKTGNPRPQAMAGFGPEWSGGAQLWWVGGKPGGVLELGLPVPADGFYKISGGFTRAIDYGSFEFSVDGQSLGQAHDFFQPEGVSHTGSLHLGSLELKRGQASFAAKILGAHPDAVKNYMLGIDFLRLERFELQPQAIFDGETLDGWAGDPQSWRVEGGAIVGEIPAGRKLAQNQFLFWDGELHDFDLRLKYRIGGDKSANSGVQFRCAKVHGGGAAGYQADIDDGALWAGRIYDEHGRGLIVERGTSVVINRAGGRAIEERRPADEFKTIVKPGDWNDYRVRAVGNHIQVWLNGELTAELIDRQIGQHDYSGQLAVQLHSGPGPAKIEFRDMVLTPLGRTLPPEVISNPNGSRPGISPEGKNLGFESGTLEGWTATGEVWAGAPIEGDTVTPRRPGQASVHDGKFWVGGYERTHSDAGQGTLSSEPFQVTHPWASFLVGAGPTPQTRVELLDAGSGEVIFKTSGAEQLENMRPVVVDLGDHLGKQIRIRIVDESSGPWGHINFDDFRFHASRPVDRPGRVATNPLLQHLVPNPSAAGAESTVAEMWVPDGFEVELIAKEPVVTQPIAFTFDERGRIWIAEAHSYPRRQADGAGKDRIIILEDVDGDGGFEKKTTFATGLNLVSGLEIGFGGVWVGAAPNLLFIPDKDRDDVPDGEAIVLLDGWGYADTHETLNSFIWGPDGWLYGNQGVFNHSKIGKPGTPEDRRIEMRAGVWRYHPQRHEFEIFSAGCSNQWGIDFDEMGHLFITHCRSAWGGGPTSYVVRGGHYWNQSNSHHAPFISGGAAGWNPGAGKVFRNFLPSSARYGHGEGGAGKPGSRALYGGHSHVGTMIYLGSNWPERYRNQLFTHNLHGHQMNRQINEREGSGFNTVHAGSDQLFTPDPRFIGVDLKYGPDGAVYMIDWYDKQHCHTNKTEAWDRSNGRLYRMAWSETYKPVKIDLRKKTRPELLSLALSKDEWLSRTARRLIQEGGPGQLEGRWPNGLETDQFNLVVASDSDPAAALRAMWALQANGLSTAHIAINHKDENVRAAAIHLRSEHTIPASRLLQIASSDPSAMVRLAVASILTTDAPDIAPSIRWEITEALAAREEDRDDIYLPKMIWYGMAKWAHSAPARAMRIADSTPMPVLADSIVWYFSRSAEGRALIAKRLEAADPATAEHLLGLMAFSLPASGQLPPPPNWAGLAARLRTPDTAPALDKLGGLFGDAEIVAAMRQTLADAEAAPKIRQEAFEFLKASGDTGCAGEFVAVLAEPAFRSQVLPLMGRFDDPVVAAALLALLPDLEGGDRNAAVGALSSQPELASAILAAIKSGSAEKSLLTSLHIRQMQTLRDKAVDALVSEVWGRANESSADAKATIEKYRKLYTDAPLWSFDRSAGEAVFTKACAICHTKDGKGKLLGPDLTGSHSSGLDYFLESIIDPNAVIGENFQLHIITQNDGKIVSGMPANETDDFITIQTLTEAVEIPKASINTRQVLDQSMMPPALLESLPEKEVIELLKYLTTE